jgi:hypothetical protein
MSAVGANSAPQVSAPEVVLTTQGQQVTVGTADIPLSSVFNCGFCRRVVAQAIGTVFIQRSGDSAPISYALTAGAAVEGNIVLIGGSTNHAGASAIALNLEV